MEPPLDPDYLDTILGVLEAHNVESFKCHQFSVSFFGEAEEEQETISTDVRGFHAPSSDDDDDDGMSPEELAKQHARAYGAPMPLLNPKGKTSK